MTLSQVDGPSATAQAFCGSSAGPAPNWGGGWRDGGAVLVMVLAPVGLAVILTTAVVFGIVGWHIATGQPVALPRATVQLMGMWSYVVGSWIDVTAVWLWSQRRGLRDEIFPVRGLSPWATAAAVAGFVVAMYGVPATNHFLSQLIGGGPAQARIDFHGAQTQVVFVLLFVVTAPLCEEILYRGLLVAWLRRRGWRDPAILVAGSLMFGANHLIPLGLAWSLVMIGFGAMLFALRLRFHSLTPGWLAHLLFNAQPLLVLPLIVRFAPGWHPGSFL